MRYAAVVTHSLEDHMLLAPPVLPAYGEVGDVEPVLLALAVSVAGCGECWSASVDRVAVSVASMVVLRELLTDSAVVLGAQLGHLPVVSDEGIAAVAFGERRHMAASALMSLQGALEVIAGRGEASSGA